MLKISWPRLASVALLALLAACGGGGDGDEDAPAEAAARLRQRTVQALAQQPRAGISLATETPSLEQTGETLMNFAEVQFPDLFPSARATLSSAPFRYRFYPETGIYLGIAVTADMGYELGGVYAMGGGFGSRPVYIGPSAALVDYDRDGVPNSDDATPLDPLCSAAGDAYAGECHLRALAGMRVKVVGNAGGKLYFAAEGDALLLFAYDLKTGHFTGRTAMTGFTPTAYAYSADHGRVYVGDSGGSIHAYSETLTPIAPPFARLNRQVNSLAAAGKFLLAHDSSGAWGTYYLFDREGIETHRREWADFSYSYEWSAPLGRLYHFRDGTSPNDLLFEVIDQTTGKITASGETPYHGDYSIRAPIRANPSGSRVLLGSGDLYAAPSLTWAGKIALNSISDALWLPGDELLVASSSDSGVRLQRFGADRAPLETLQLQAGSELLALVRQDAGAWLVVKLPTHVDIRSYAPSNDSDGDGVDNASDRFPLDPAAAADSDGDGHPDAWLPGRSAADSTTGLTLDAYPQDASCHAPEQGNGVSCDPSLHAPAAPPDFYVSDGQGNLFMLSRDARRIYRWSSLTGGYLSPIVVGQPDAGGVLRPPRAIAHSADHGRIYLGYDTGLVTWIDASGSSAEKHFGAVAMGVRGLAAAGKYLLVQDSSGAWATHYLFDKAGVVTDSKDWNYFSRHYAWAANQNRIYFFRDDSSPNDLMYEEIDQATGKIKSAGETPYHGSYSIIGPIRVSPGGGRIALGSGDIYSSTDLTVVKSLGAASTDIQWLPDGRLAALAFNGANSRVTVYTSAFAVQRQLLVDGAPLALFGIGSDVAAITQAGGAIRVTRLTP